MEPEGIIEPLDAIVDGHRSSSEGLKLRANGGGDFYVTGGAACFLTAQHHHRYSCSSHTEACNVLGTTDGATSHC